MKRVVLVIIGCLIFCTSCIGAFLEEVDGGFPDKIYIPKEGGELTLTGSMRITHITIEGKDKNGRSSTKQEDGSIEVKHDWLRVRAEKEGSNTIKIYAEPNTSKKSRKCDLYINPTIGYEYACITVKQD